VLTVRHIVSPVQANALNGRYPPREPRFSILDGTVDPTVSLSSTTVSATHFLYSRQRTMVADLGSRLTAVLACQQS
jgi:hypothetical protein